MPDKPLWVHRLTQAVATLEQLPVPWVDRGTIEELLGVRRRRAQQILQPLVRHTIGKNGLALKEDVIAYLRQLAQSDTATYEHQRRKRLAELIQSWYREAREQPRVLVEAPETIVNQELANLPQGIRLSPGLILIEGFTTPEEAKQQLLALIMAIGNHPEEFDEQVAAQAVTIASEGD